MVPLSLFCHVTKNPNDQNIRARLYLLEDESKYRSFDLLGNESTFDVDVANLPCGLNGAVFSLTERFCDGVTGDSEDI